MTEKLLTGTLSLNTTNQNPYQMFTYIQNEISFQVECIPINSLTIQKVTKSFIFYQTIYRKIDIGVAPFLQGET